MKYFRDRDQILLKFMWNTNPLERKYNWGERAEEGFLFPTLNDIVKQ